MDVVCFPDATWDSPLQTNRQHVMRTLVQQVDAARVLYVDPPRFIGKIRSGWLREVSSNLWVLRIPTPVPNRWLRKNLFGWLQAYQNRWVAWALNKLKMQRVIVWSFSPVFSAEKLPFNPTLHIYDVVDDYLTQAFYSEQTGANVQQQESQQLAAADLVFFTTAALKTSKSPEKTQAHVLGNAANVDLFGRVLNENFAKPDDIAHLDGKIIGFFGAIIAKKVDINLLKRLALAHPTNEIVLIGPVHTDSTDVSVLEKLPNVTLLGLKSQEELPAYLAHFDVCIIPYAINAYTKQIYALKLHEYLAAGKPVVTTDLPCFAPFADAVAVAKDDEMFLAMVSAELATKPDPQQQIIRHQIAIQHSWQNKVKAQYNLIQQVLST